MNEVLVRKSGLPWARVLLPCEGCVTRRMTVSFPQYCLVSLLGLALSVAPLAGHPAVLVGVVRDDSTGKPLSGAEVLIEGVGRRATTDVDGRFAFGELPPGLRTLLARQIGFHPLGVVIHLGLRDTTRVEVRLAAMTVQLAPIEVTATPARGPRGIGREGFEERMRLGFGRFIDLAQIRRSEHLRLADLLRREGVALLPPLGGLPGGGILHALNSRLRNSQGRLYCYMQIVYDGQVVFRGGPAWLIDDPRGVPNMSMDWYPSDLERVEIYRSPAEVPQEFGGPTAACGVIVLWSRRG
jgi:hypothetical protein